MHDRASKPLTAHELAGRPDFRLGDALIRPSLHIVEGRGGHATIEPRVMQVLLTLADAGGDVVSRDDLTHRCWGGQIVSDDAINRSIAEVRRAARGVAADAFAVETIPRTGYRLVISEAVAGAPSFIAPAAPAATTIGRRALIGAGLVAAAGGGVAWLLAGSDGNHPSSAARSLYDKAIEAEREGGRESGIRATAFLEEATRLDPQWGSAWGALALAYRNSVGKSGESAMEEEARRTRAAARRAQSLNSGNADAEAALILTPHFFRNWLTIEAQCRDALLRHPNHWQLQFNLGLLMCQVGRWGAGLEHFDGLLLSDPSLLVVRRSLGPALWGAGRIDEADEETQTTLKRWPDDPTFWLTRFNFLAFTGRAGAAMELLANETANTLDSPLPSDIAEPLVRALSTRSASDARHAVGVLLDAREQGRVATVQSVPYLAALGAHDTAFNLLDPYYFGRVSPAGERQVLPRLAQRSTAVLFAPATAPLRSDERFARLTQSLGLDDYWRATRTVPDWKRR